MTRLDSIPLSRVAYGPSVPGDDTMGPRPEDRSPRMRVLLVEDDAKITAFVMKGFQQAGLAVDHAANGVAGLELALAVPYDAAVIDLMLPAWMGSR